MKWLLVVPAIPVALWLGLFVFAWFQPAICLQCGHEVKKGNERYDCPGHGTFEGDEYIGGEWIDPIIERGFNVNPRGTIYDTPTGVPAGRVDPTIK